MYRSSRLGIGVMAAAAMLALAGPAVYQEPPPRRTRTRTDEETGNKVVETYAPEPVRNHTPHQGKREMARRQRRMQKGGR